MKRIIENIGIVMVLFALLSSCTKNLELSPISEISVASLWKTEEDAKGAINGIYARFRTQVQENLYRWGGARSEEISYGINGSEGREFLFNNTLSAVNPGPDWLRLYSVLHDVNLVLKYVPNIDFTDQKEKNKILAEAYTMRAYIYYILVRTWGAVPIIKEPTESFNPSAPDAYKTQNSPEEIFAFIKEDIGLASGLFADNAIPAGRAYWSKPALNALKGDVYLWTGKILNGGRADFEIALSALEDVKTADVTLLSSFDQVFRGTNKGNKEVLFAVQFKQNESGNQYGQDMYIAPTEIPSDGDAASRGLIGVGGGLNRWAPSEILRSQFQSTDTRKNVTFTEIYRFPSGVRTFYASVALKYKGGVTGGARLFLDDVIIYRYADVLLMIAEAKNALDLDPSDEINEVRQRAYGANYAANVFVSTDKIANDEAILKERLLELAFEGKRWWDLIRFDKAMDLVPSLQSRDRGLLLFPISQSTLSLNPKLIQNEAYRN
ncbi:RagB/SusD family nutrient uptake outer membrane protein [Parapedobacter sp. SGR-10]|nr:RagB/SusD family nutrient uptake outer membrane protein [Parapedobacter sp. SGR-10]